MDTSDEWIRQRSGIRQRYIAGEGETTSTLATRREAALAHAGLKAEDIDLIVAGDRDAGLHLSGDGDPGPGQSRHHPGLAFDLQAVCSGFVFASATADKFLRSGSHKRALVIGAETFSRILDWNDRRTCVLFGDGAGAMVLEAQESDGAFASRGVIAARLRSDGGIAPSSSSTADLRPLRPPAIFGWRARKCSATPSAWSRT